jgi:hypothetical protein
MSTMLSALQYVLKTMQQVLKTCMSCSLQKSSLLRALLIFLKITLTWQCLSMLTIKTTLCFHHKKIEVEAEIALIVAEEEISIITQTEVVTTMLEGLQMEIMDLQVNLVPSMGLISPILRGLHVRYVAKLVTLLWIAITAWIMPTRANNLQPN